MCSRSRLAPLGSLGRPTVSPTEKNRKLLTIKREIVTLLAYSGGVPGRGIQVYPYHHGLEE